MRARLALLLALCACGSVPSAPDAGSDAPPEPTMITLTSHRADGQPVDMEFVAFQDGDGVWQAVTGAAGVYSFRVSSARYGVAAACTRADGGAFVTYQYAAISDPRMRYVLNNCASTPAFTVPISGSAAGVPMGQQLIVSSGSSSALLPPGAWSTSAIAGAGTLVATAATSQRPTSIIVRKVTYAANASFALDFAANGVPPTESDLMLDPTGTSPFMTTTYYDEEGGSHQIDLSTVAVARYRSVPADRVGNGVTVLRAQASATGASRSIERAFRIPVTQVMLLPAAYLPVDVPRYVTSTTPPTIEGIIARAPGASHYQLSFTSVVLRTIQLRDVTITAAWAALSPAGNLTVRLPDLSSVAGYKAAFAPPTVNANWNISANTGPARLVPGAFAYRNARPTNHLAAGEEATSSSSNGAVR